MSAGAFARSKYESNRGDIYFVRVQPETLLLNVGGVNSAPAGDIDAEPSAQISGSRRSIGVHTRGVRVVFTAGAPVGYLANSPIFIPILTQATYDAIARGDTGSYLGGTVEVLGKVAEVIR